MKTIFFSLLVAYTLNAQDFKPNDIVGTWLPVDESVHINIYEARGKYYANCTKSTGELIRSRDIYNPNENLRNRYLSEALIIKDLVYDSDGHWSDGEIYDPAKGKFYSCKIEMVDRNTIKVTGYKLISIFWQYEIWKRIR